MANSLLVSCSRTSLGLADLDLNDHVAYITSGSSVFSGTVSWRRNTVSSPYVDSQVLVGAVKDLVQDEFSVEVLNGPGGTHLDLQNNLKTLITAFSQWNFNITFQWDTAVYTYSCMPSDYSVDWTQGRAQSQQLLVKFSLQRSPVPINGV